MWKNINPKQEWIFHSKTMILTLEEVCSAHFQDKAYSISFVITEIAINSEPSSLHDYKSHSVYLKVPTRGIKKKTGTRISI